MPGIIRKKIPVKEKGKGEKKSPVTEPKSKKKRMSRAGRSRGLAHKLGEMKKRSQLKGAARKGERNRLRIGLESVPASKKFAGIHIELYNRAKKVDYSRPIEAAVKRTAIAEYMRRIDTTDLELKLRGVYSNDNGSLNYADHRRNGGKTFKRYVQQRIGWLEKVTKPDRAGWFEVPLLSDLIELRLARRILGKLK